MLEILCVTLRQTPPTAARRAEHCEILWRGGGEAEPVNGCFLTNSADLAPVVLTPDEEEYSAVEGMSLTMRCEVFSSPPPDIYW